MSSSTRMFFFLTAFCIGLAFNALTLTACGQPQNEATNETNQETPPAETINEITPEINQEAPPAEQTKEATIETNQEAPPIEQTNDASPQETAPEIAPENIAELTPEIAPETTPEIAPEATQETTPEATPETMAETTPEQTTSPTPNSTDPAVVWSWLQQQGYRAWDRAPGFATRQPSSAPHGGAVEIFVNGTVQQILTNKTPITAWPLGSIIVKDGYNGSNLALVAYMEKRSNGWLWFEWNGTGTILYQGQPGICTGCHSSGADSVRAFAFP